MDRNKTKTRARRERGERCEYVFDRYTIDCIEKIKALGFGSRKEAVKFAIHQLADRIERGEVKERK